MKPRHSTDTFTEVERREIAAALRAAGRRVADAELLQRLRVFTEAKKGAPQGHVPAAWRVRAAAQRIADAEHPTEDWTKAPPLKGPCLRAFHAFAAAHKDAWEDVPLDQVFKAGYEAGRCLAQRGRSR